jgi:hypothetical protein
MHRHDVGAREILTGQSSNRSLSHQRVTGAEPVSVGNCAHVVDLHHSAHRVRGPPRRVTKASNRETFASRRGSPFPEGAAVSTGASAARPGQACRERRRRRPHLPRCDSAAGRAHRARCALAARPFRQSRSRLRRRHGQLVPSSAVRERDPSRSTAGRRSASPRWESASWPGSPTGVAEAAAGWTLAAPWQPQEFDGNVVREASWTRGAW